MSSAGEVSDITMVFRKIQVSISELIDVVECFEHLVGASASTFGYHTKGP